MTEAATPSLGRRALRSSMFTLVGYGSSMVIRLGSNLILTRILFPEAFGLMALVMIFLTGLQMISDLGLNQSIMQSRRGDDPDFLDTAWTLGMVRGGILFVLALAITPAFAWFYEEPQLLTMLPVAALGVLIAPLGPTRGATADRHLRAGRVTMLDLAAQTTSVVFIVVMAWIMQSPWALLLGTLVGTTARVIYFSLGLPGHRNRLRWEPEAAREIIRFGVWILLSSLCGFFLGQADKLVLGYLLDLRTFGLYNIAWNLATLPLALGAAVMGRLVIPLYRESPPAESPLNARRVRRLRGAALAALLGLASLLALGGAPLLRALYDPRYEEAAHLLVMLAIMQAPALLLMTCDQAALAMGDSRRFFGYTLARMALTFTGLLVGWEAGGLVGAIVGQGLANLATYPVLVWLLRPHRAWDPRVDATALAAAAGVAALALFLQAEGLAAGVLN